MSVKNQTISPLQQRVVVFTTALQDLLRIVMRVEQENIMLKAQIKMLKNQGLTKKEKIARKFEAKKKKI